MKKYKKLIRLMKDELAGQIMKELRAKICTYFKDNNDADKNKKAQKMRHKKSLKFQDYRNCLKTAQIENEINYLE